MKRIWNKAKSLTKTSLAVVGTVTVVSAIPFLYDFYEEKKESSSKKPEKQVLVVPFDHLQLVESVGEKSYLERIVKSKVQEPKITMELKDFVSLIDEAGKDPKIVALYGKGNPTVKGFAQLEEVRNAILRFRSHLNSSDNEEKIVKTEEVQKEAILEENKNTKESEKPAFKESYFYADHFDDLNSLQKSYYLASSFNRIIFQHRGNVNLFGIRMEKYFLKSLLEKYGIKVNVFKQGKYKNAPDILTKSKMTCEEDENLTSLISSLQNTIVSNISSCRCSNPNFNASLWNSIMKYGTMTALNAKEVGLIDEIELNNPIEKYGDVIELKDYLAKLERKKQLEKLQKHYEKLMNLIQKKETKEERIAIVPVVGTITDKVATVVVSHLTKIKKDPSVKCVILRVDSPGGSALASERILSEFNSLAQPVICSMGNYAASGGYYVASNSKKIFAQPTTITGSIGVFGVKFDLTDWASRNGINAFAYSAGGSFPMDLSPFQPLTKESETVFQRYINHFYRTFLTIVSEGRNKSLQEVHAIAQGRVYTGRQAKEIGLVDTLGGITDAIQYAQQHFTHGKADVFVYADKSGFSDVVNVFDFSFDFLNHFITNDEAVGKVLFAMDDVTAVQFMFQELVKAKK